MPRKKDDINLRYYLSLVGHKIQILLNRLNRIPTSSSNALAEILKRILVQSFDELERLSTRIGIMDDRDIKDRTWFIHFFSTRLVSRWINVIEKSKTSGLTSGIVDAFNDICNNAHLGTSLVIYPTSEHNFTYEDVSELLTTIANRINSDSSDPIMGGKYSRHVVITYPELEEDTPLNQILIGHEIGHFIDQINDWSGSIEELNIFPGLNQGKENQEITTNISYYNKVLSDIGRSWIKEIVADSIAVILLGPAYVLSMPDFIFINPTILPESRELSLTHPPIQLRLKIMAQYALKHQVPSRLNSIAKMKSSTKTLGIYKVLRDTLKQYANDSIDEFERINSHDDIPPEGAKWVFNQLSEGLQNTVKELKILSDDFFKPDQVFSQVDTLHAVLLSKYLDHGFIPTELPAQHKGILPSIPAVLNSGWFYLLANRKDGVFDLFNLTSDNSAPPNEITKSMISVHKRVAKAVEVLNFTYIYHHQSGNDRR